MEKRAVFTVRPVKGTNTAIIKCIGHVVGTEKIADESLECNKQLDGDKYSYMITDTIFARFYHCNVTDIFLLTTKKLPVMYASIMYRTNLIGGLLFNLFIDFTVTTEVKNESNLVGNILEGKYSLRIKSDNDPERIIELDLYHGQSFMIDIMKSLLESEEMKSLIAKLMEDRRLARVDYLGSMDDVEVPKAKYNFTKLVQEYKSTGKINI
ncbi:MAG: hypothetical protein Hyperionvirus8_25 [Hyperionvirus sp.]|uniref:Uncharacterized protein n=1 Tax=Hyperionvirus sp. TaxID=2487770 RepID=A0A3G5ABA3_9VIRU|nr:MAG: hypothetical protein Hyperionvirus8_25 [Hyperionvirus sp.]